MDATTVTLALMQKFVGPDNKINEMSDFYDALVKALEDAHAEGRDEATQENAGVSAEVEAGLPHPLRGFSQAKRPARVAPLNKGPGAATRRGLRLPTVTHYRAGNGLLM